MSTYVNANPPVRTWRDIQQAIAPKAMSSEGRKRLLVGTVKSVSVLFALCLSGWGLYEAMRTWEQNPMAIKSPVKSAPVKTIDSRSDGVLDKAWVTRTLALPKNAGLMELDLQALQARLMDSGQVRTAVLTRKFPTTLLVMVEERWPVARVRAQLAGESPKDMLVARDGVIYEGVGYDSAVVGSLPYLADVALRATRGHFHPLEGMDKVAELLSLAHANIPALYRNWQIVSLARYVADGFIIVRSKEVKEITFDSRESDFYQQIAKLDLIVEAGHIESDHPAISVNLAIGETQGGAQVPVVFETPPSTSATGSSKSSAGRPVTPAPSTRVAPQRPALFTNLHFSSREF
jgi:cell division protein FtsQ